MVAGARVYDDFSYSSYSGAMKSAVRALVMTGKPVGMLGWRGAHAQMITGYYGLVGEPVREGRDRQVHEHLHGERLLPVRSAALVESRQPHDLATPASPRR